MNRWRSPTAESVYQRRAFLNVRSRGTSRHARQPIRAEDLAWADIVFVMEHKHKTRLLADYSDVLRFKPLHVLDIPDEYQFMDEELIVEITAQVDPILADARPGP